MLLMSGANCVHFARRLLGRFGGLDELSQINHEAQNVMQGDICQFQSWAKLARQLIWWEELRRLVRQQIATSGLTEIRDQLCLSAHVSSRLFALCTVCVHCKISHSDTQAHPKLEMSISIFCVCLLKLKRQSCLHTHTPGKHRPAYTSSPNLNANRGCSVH